MDSFDDDNLESNLNTIDRVIPYLIINHDHCPIITIKSRIDYTNAPTVSVLTTTTTDPVQLTNSSYVSSQYRTTFTVTLGSVEPGWEFTNWSLDHTAGDNNAELETAIWVPAVPTTGATTSVVLTAITIRRTALLTAFCDPPNSGVVVINDTGANPNGTQSGIITLRYILNPGFVFVRWSGDATGTGTTTTVSMDSGDATVVCLFRGTSSSTLTHSKTPISCPCSVTGPASGTTYTTSANTSISLTAVLATDYEFVNWTDVRNGNCPIHTNLILNLIMNQEYNVKANFKYVKRIKICELLSEKAIQNIAIPLTTTQQIITCSNVDSGLTTETSVVVRVSFIIKNCSQESICTLRLDKYTVTSGISAYETKFQNTNFIVTPADVGKLIQFEIFDTIQRDSYYNCSYILYLCKNETED